MATGPLQGRVMVSVAKLSRFLTLRMARLNRTLVARITALSFGAFVTVRAYSAADIRLTRCLLWKCVASRKTERAHPQRRCDNSSQNMLHTSTSCEHRRNVSFVIKWRLWPSAYTSRQRGKHRRPLPGTGWCGDREGTGCTKGRPCATAPRQQPSSHGRSPDTAGRTQAWTTRVRLHAGETPHVSPACNRAG